ncbi:MAG: NADH-quinone oxidoreductase subunit M [Verrucomicrobiota bacterium]
MLTILLLVPILGAVSLLLGKGDRGLTKICALLQTALTLTIWFAYDRTKAGYQFTFASDPLLPGLDLRFSLGVDGLSLLLLLLSAFVSLAAVWLAPKAEKRPQLYDACILLISAGVTGAFASQDLFFFYAFHELALIPTFLMIGLWGSGERQAAAWKITVYLALGSIILLIGLVDLFLAIPSPNRSFDLVKLQQIEMHHLIPVAKQLRPWCFLTVGFGILVSLFPFHSWAPTGYASAPTPVAMLHSGVLKKFGLYGMLRLVVPLLPDAGKLPVYSNWTAMDLLLLALLGNILYIGLVTIAQRKLDYVIAYSSVMHMGYIFLGIASLNLIGLTGSALLMFAHGLSVAALFAVAGAIREREGSLSLDRLGGAAKSVPFLGICFAMATFASIGLPGFANFASETMVFFGAFKDPGSSFIRTATILSLWGVVISAVYMLRAYKSAFLGAPTESSSKWADLTGSSKLVLGSLITLLLLGGFFPKYFISYLKPTLELALR